MPFNNLDELESYIKEQIASSLSSDVAESVKEVERNMIQKDVFAVYDPFSYERRASGGLDDISNMVTSEPTIIGNQIILSISNVTTGYNETNFYIAPLVEYGDSAYNSDVGQGEYTWKYNREGTAMKFLKPRPFNEDTINELEMSEEHILVLMKSLQQKGFTFK